MNSATTLTSANGDAVVDGEIGEQLALRAGDELRALAADDDILGRGLDLGDELEEVGVERTAEALVGGDEDDAAHLDLAPREQRVLALFDAAGDGGEHLGHELGVGAAGQGGLLRLLHLRRSHHLHRLGDLAGVLDRLDASADVAEWRPWRLGSRFRWELTWR